MKVVQVDQVRVPHEFATDVRVTIRVDERNLAPADYSIVERIGHAAHLAAWQLTGGDRVDRGRSMEHVRR